MIAGVRAWGYLSALEKVNILQGSKNAIKIAVVFSLFFISNFIKVGKNAGE